MFELNETHDPLRRSWVESANLPETDFPIQNLPFCMFMRNDGASRPGVAIGDSILDLVETTASNLIDKRFSSVVHNCVGRGLNALMKQDRNALSLLRRQLSDILAANSKKGESQRDRLLVQRDDVVFRLPAEIGGFSDFFTSLHHTERVGRVIRPDGPVPPNFRYMPIAYNSRASSVRASGEHVRRPNGQLRNEDGSVHFGPTKALDFELELGAFVGAGNDLGAPISIGQADEHVFGLCLLNDWSARDIQRWETFPLGPFLGKSLSTTISPFVVTMEAMAPFRVPALERPPGDPAPLPYLHSRADQQHGGIDLRMEAMIETRKMREGKVPPFRVTTANFKEMYWTFAQMLTHHTSNGCNLQTGDLIGSGTVSGPTNDSRACMAEITGGKHPINLPTGEARTWLLDDDDVVFRARAERQGHVSIGFGECRGRIAAASA